MRQLLTIPPRLADEKPAWIWAWLVLLLFCLPAFVYGTVAFDDLRSAYKLPQTPRLSKDLIGEALCLAAVLVLTALCVKLLLGIHRIWEQFAQDFRTDTPPEKRLPPTGSGPGTAASPR
jgi:hypothetical protein